MINVLCIAFGACFGGFLGICVAVWTVWPNVPADSQLSYINSSEGSYTDLMLTLVTVMLAAIGIMMAVGAIVIGLFSWRGVRAVMDQILHKSGEKAFKKVSKEVIEKATKKVVKNVIGDESYRKSLDEIVRNVSEKEAKNIMEMVIRGELDQIFEEFVTRVSFNGPVVEEGSEFFDHDSEGSSSDNRSEEDDGKNADSAESGGKIS